MTFVRALALLALAAPAAAEPGPAVAAAIDRFQAACSVALTDPDAYIASLTLPGPAGEEGAYHSPDGQYLLIHTAQTQGLTDYVEFTGLRDSLVRRCAISAVIPGYPDAPQIDAVLKPMLDARATQVVGGETPRITPIWEPGDEAIVFEGEPLFIYHATGLLSGLAAPAQITVQSGGIDFAAIRIVTGPEAQR